MQLIFLFYYLIIFTFGLLIGSFLNCVIYRLEKEESLWGRSYCPHCKHALDWQNLFPVASFLWLGGKCSYCSKKISWQYPFVEISTGLVFLLILSNSQFLTSSQFQAYNVLNLLFLFYIASSLIVIFVYDLKHYIIPDKILLPAIFIALFYRIVFSFSDFYLFVIAALVASGFFFLIFLVSRGMWIGFGDVKLAILLGLLLGLPGILVGLFLAFLFGAIIGLILMLLSKKGLKSQIPFAPFLIAGSFGGVIFGDAILNFYLKLILV